MFLSNFHQFFKFLYQISTKIVNFHRHFSKFSPKIFVNFYLNFSEFSLKFFQIFTNVSPNRHQSFEIFIKITPKVLLLQIFIKITPKSFIGPNFHQNYPKSFIRIFLKCSPKFFYIFSKIYF